MDHISYGRVSPSLLPLGQEEVGGEVLGGVDVVLGHEAGASLEWKRLVQVIVVSNGGMADHMEPSLRIPTFFALPGVLCLCRCSCVTIPILTNSSHRRTIFY